MRLDLNTPEFQDALFALQSKEMKQVLASLSKLRQLSWAELYRHPGFRWEAIAGSRAPNGERMHSLRLSQRIRILAYRDGEFLCPVSLHPDHDSAYQ